jgi:hypothetical protein
MKSFRGLRDQPISHRNVQLGVGVSATRGRIGSKRLFVLVFLFIKEFFPPSPPFKACTELL